MPPRFYTRRTRTRIRLNQPDLLFHFMHWHLWFWGPSILLFIIGLFPAQTKMIFLISQVASLLITALLDLPADVASRVKTIDATIIGRMKTGALLVTAWLLESAVVYWVSEWSRQGFSWSAEALSLVYTLVMIIAVQTTLPAIVRCVKGMRFGGCKVVLLWSSLGLIEFGVVYCGNRYSIDGMRVL
ncbi:hypothetical protein EV356DRAFT_531065 [Viridothelium virens]|uniref:Uncharacterized protein n=1 Tax=Viridothelium virens TaxID=1048519 RepID=A0A6A6HEV3_VIRVR|nr:hypothetical protein EV356DRAFT_531065 [Viridothelium virens]